MLSRGGPAESRIALSQGIEGQLYGKSLIGRSWPMAGLRERRLPGASIGAAACLPGSELEAHPERLGVLQPPRA